MSNERDYDLELKDVADHKYAYNFDFDVMHPFMLKSFLPFFRPGNCLELGSFKGDFTRRLLQHFHDITRPFRRSNEFKIFEIRLRLGKDSNLLPRRRTQP